jgi:hypothetical protein
MVNLSRNKLKLGTLPSNGTICVSDNTGERNMFVKQWIAQQKDETSGDNAVEDNKPSASTKSQKLGLGISLGVTVLASNRGILSRSKRSCATVEEKSGEWNAKGSRIIGSLSKHNLFSMYSIVIE